MQSETHDGMKPRSFHKNDDGSFKYPDRNSYDNAMYKWGKINGLTDVEIHICLQNEVGNIESFIAKKWGSK